MDAFDADVLIYAAVPSHRLGRRVLALFDQGPLTTSSALAGVGSVLLLPELLSRLDMRPVDETTAELAVALAASYRLTAADAVHLATAVGVGADRFLTNNHRDFPQTITEIDIRYPDDLPDPA